MSWVIPLILENSYCKLEPLSIDHLNALIDAVKDGELWKIHYARVPEAHDMQQEINRRLEAQEQGQMLPFTVFEKKTGKIVGMTTYCHIDSVNKRLNIGWTWYAKSHHRTALNTACKQLLLTHAFEKLNCIAVGFRVDVLNQPSQNAVERLGARFEGIMRNHSVLPNGNLQDMRFYSILPNEWPQIKTHLQWLLEKYSNI